MLVGVIMWAYEVTNVDGWKWGGRPSLAFLSHNAGAAGSIHVIAAKNT